MHVQSFIKKSPAVAGPVYGIGRPPGIESGCRAGEALAKMDDRVHRRPGEARLLDSAVLSAPRDPSIEKKDRPEPRTDEHRPGERFQNGLAFGGALGRPHRGRCGSDGEPMTAQEFQQGRFIHRMECTALWPTKKAPPKRGKGAHTWVHTQTTGPDAGAVSTRGRSTVLTIRCPENPSIEKKDRAKPQADQ
jgi:hypothetical protein